MKNMLYITKLISRTNEEVYIYMALEDFKKYAFTKKGEFLYPYDDKKLLDVLNNVDGKMYEEVVEEKKNEKKKLTLRERVQKTLSILGIAATIIAVEPAAVELVSYSLKRIKAHSYSSVVDDSTKVDEYLKQFSIAINKNEDYTSEERATIIEGFQKYINDWGYLFDETDKQYMLHMIENVKVDRNAWLPKWASGDYALGTMNIKEGYDEVGVVSHETGHALSDRGLIVGTINGYGFGYALNEGINTSVNDKYYSFDGAYPEQRTDVFKLSLLVDNETLIKAYQKEGPTYVASAIADSIPGVAYLDVIKYISMMDIELFIGGYAVFGEYSLPDSFYEGKQELYNKMFRAKYGYDFNESVLSEVDLAADNFLEEKFTCTREEGIYYREYEFSKEELLSKADEFDFTGRAIDEFVYVEERDSVKLLEANPEEKLIELGSWEVFAAHVMNKKPSVEEVQKIKIIFTEGVDENNFDVYARSVVSKALSFEESLEFVTCYIRLASDKFKYQYGFYTELNSILISELKKNGRDDVVDLYSNTTMTFASFNYDDPSDYSIDDYYNLRRVDDYIITDEGKLILKLDEDEEEFNDLIYDGTVMSQYTWSFPEVGTYDELFDCENGRYRVFDFKEAGIEDINRDAIDLTVLIYPEVKYDNNSFKASK